ncbi:PDR/VanB family oxidoreductase [Demequina sp.]|uniref:PDR/VanB family oxidoreductase n=1 Tax=Demequina sp. TaxID=2050685 RepID=UPI0025BBC65F|nr:PDR/VanB family oxidoreductase [Demequina sp.]
MNEAEPVRTLTVASRRELADSVIELELADPAGGSLPALEPGDHIDLRLGADMIRQYSLVGLADHGDTWRVAVLVDPAGRGGSALISESLQEGATIDVSGPRNHFALEPAPSYRFIAGGIGVTPLIEMCRRAEAIGADWSLAYLGRSRQSMAYLDELIEEFGSKVQAFISAEGSRYDVAGALADVTAETLTYCCGPERLMGAVEESMQAAGRLTNLRLERFEPKPASGIVANEEFVVYATKSDVEFVVPEDESILVAADFEGLVVPGDCLEGTCGSCETRIVSGEVEHRDSILNFQAQAESKTMMICVSRARRGCPRLELEL